jgi:site-specific DNA recombinase
MARASRREQDMGNAQKLAAIYTRVSTQTQEEEGTSLDTQEAHCRAYAQAHGYQVDPLHIYREAHTGTELWQRPRLTTLREVIRSGQIQGVIAYAIDRLSRNPAHLGVLMTEAEYHGVQVEFVTEPVDHSPEGQLIQYVRGYAALVEHEKIRERSYRGKLARIQSGKLHNHGRELYGYRRDNTQGRRQIYEPEAAIVREIFQWYVEEGLSIKALRRRLHTRAIPAPSVGKVTYADVTRVPQWGHGQLYRLLTEPAYKGETIVWRFWKSGYARPPEDWIRLGDDVTPAIVSEPIWNAAQQRLATNTGAETRNTARPYLLRGHIRCAVCNRPLRANPERSRRTYRCASRETLSGPCGGKRVPGEDIESWVWDQITTLLRDPDLIAAEVQRRRDATPDPTLGADQDATRRHLAKLEKQQAKLLAVFRQQDEEELPLPWDLLKRELARLEQEKQALQDSLQTLEQRLAAHQAALAQLEHVKNYCATVASRLTTFSFAEKRLALEALDIEVIANGREWRIHGSVPLEAYAGTVFQPSARYVLLQQRLQGRA